MKITLYTLSLLWLLTATSCTTAQNKNYDAASHFTVMFYNVENLFDTIDTENVSDSEFSPQGKKHWNTQRYTKKLNDLAGVISRINTEELPEIVGLCEVENRQVIEDLIATKKLTKGGYAIVHEDSPSPRGIDVALIYRKSEFEYISHQALGVSLPEEPEYKFRDILYVKGKTGGETLHLFVNHWKSRRGGRAETEFKRVASAKVLRAKIDQIQKKNKKAKIIIIGDFNDTPQNRSIKEILRAGSDIKRAKKGDLFNLMYAKSINKKGTNHYKDKWYMLDNLIVSQQLMTGKKGWKVSPDGGEIYYDSSVLYNNPKANTAVPNKTYGGPKYYGGISDHLPVYFMMNN